jgi:hypothetical protein
MKPSDSISCDDFSCSGARTDVHLIPTGVIDPEKIKVVMISEAPPPDPGDYFLRRATLST